MLGNVCPLFSHSVFNKKKRYFNKNKLSPLLSENKSFTPQPALPSVFHKQYCTKCGCSSGYVSGVEFVSLMFQQKQKIHKKTFVFFFSLFCTE